MDVTLYQLPWSPPSVRARWALAERGVRYRAVVYLPGTHHSVRVRLATGQSSVPVAWIDGRPIAGSTEIARAIDGFGDPAGRLFFDDPNLAAELDAWVARSDRLFDAARRALGPALAGDREALRAVITPGPAWAHALVPVLWRFSGWEWARRYGVAEPDRTAAAEIEALATAMERDRAGRAWLVGDRFSYADIAVASMLCTVRGTPHLAIPPPLARHYAHLAAAGPWDPLFAWRDALLDARRPAIAPSA